MKQEELKEIMDWGKVVYTIADYETYYFFKESKHDISELLKDSNLLDMLEDKMIEEAKIVKTISYKRGKLNYYIKYLAEYCVEEASGKGKTIKEAKYNAILKYAKQQLKEKEK